MLDDGNLATSLLNLLSRPCPCPSCFPKDNYYTSVLSIYVLVDDAVDCSII